MQTVKLIAKYDKKDVLDDMTVDPARDTFKMSINEQADSSQWLRLAAKWQVRTVTIPPTHGTGRAHVMRSSVPP